MPRTATPVDHVHAVVFSFTDFRVPADEISSNPTGGRKCGNSQIGPPPPPHSQLLVASFPRLGQGVSGTHVAPMCISTLTLTTKLSGALFY